MIRHHDYIDALRGWAILLVILTHTSQGAPALAEPGAQLLAQGARGVQLFFVVSALTLLISWHQRDDGALNFYVRRLFRIGPMFWLATLFFSWLNGDRPTYYAPHGTDLSHIALTATFSHGWHPHTINALVPGGWTIADEMGFYLLFPLLVMAIRGWKTAALAFVISVVLASWLQDWAWAQRAQFWPGQTDDLVSTFLHLWLPTQFPSFMVGFVLFFALRGTIPHRLVPGLLLVAAIAGGVLLAFRAVPLRTGSVTISIYAAYAVCFGALAYAMAQGAAGRLLNNGAIRYLGRISFSAYLWHFAIQQLEAAFLPKASRFLFGSFSDGVYFLGYTACILTLTVIASTVTYRFIERPMIRLGNRLLSRRPPDAAAVAVPPAM